MPNWKKVITSGSDASLNSLYVALDITGSDALITNDLDVLGNVGIGTTSPTNKLQVTGGSVGIDSEYMVRDNRNNTILLQSANTAASNRSLTIGNATYSSTVIPNGNVGIGTTSPSYPLDIRKETVGSGFWVNLWSSATKPDAQAGSIYGGFFSSTGNSSATVNNIIGSRNYAEHTGTGQSDFIAGSSHFAIHNGSGNSTGIYSISPKAEIKGTGTGSHTYAIGVNSNTVLNNPNATVQYLQGAHINISLTSGEVTDTVSGLVLDADGTGATISGDFEYLRIQNDTLPSVTGYARSINSLSTLPSFFSGSIGIGTTTPTQKLHVSGSARITGAYYDSTNSPGTSGQVLSSTATGTDWVSLSEISGVDGSGTANYLAKWSDADTITDSVIYDNGTNIGIGTTNPGSQKLHVVGDIKATTKIFVEDSTNSRLEFASSISNQARISAHKSNLGQTLPLLIQAEGIKFGTVGGGEKMRMDSSGNLGIGTTSPGANLEIRKSASDGIGPVLRLRADDSNDGNPEIQLYRGSGGAVGSRIYLENANTDLHIDNLYDASSTYGRIFFRTQTVGTPINAMTIMPEGNVGIGTTSPDYNLQVESTGNAEIHAQRLSGAGVLVQAQAAAGVVGTTTNHDLDIKTNGSTRIKIENTGNVGIGTTSPAQKLDVVGYIRSGNTGTDNTSKYSKFQGRHYTNSEEDILAISTESTLSSNNVYIGGGFSTNNSSTAIRFYTATNATTTTGAERMRIDSSGNVGIGTTSPSAKLDIEGDLQVKGVNISNQENLDVDTGTETIATVAIADYDAAFFDYVVKNGTDLRAGTVSAVHNGTSVEFAETSTSDLGNTTRLTLSVDISGTDMRLRATATSDNWIVKTLVRAI